MTDRNATYALAFDTANELIAVGVGRLEEAAEASSRRVRLVAHAEIEARRASNTQLLPTIDALLEDAGIGRGDIATVACGRGPGSFTGVRIAMATAKGIACALGVGLIGVSSLDAVAWNAWAHDVRGTLAVVADAMRKEVYPVRFELSDGGVHRLETDSVLAVAAAAQKLADCAISPSDLLIAGDALAKYADAFAPLGTLLPADLRTPTGLGLLLAVQAAWRLDEADPFDAARHHPALVLPVYTRLSDAEENERKRLATQEAKDLAHGVQGGALSSESVAYQPLDSAHAEAAAQLEQLSMGAGAWSAASLRDELGRPDRVWWMALSPDNDNALIGYAGGLIVAGELQILKVAVQPAWRRRGIARTLLARVADDARNLGAERCTLEVRAGNVGAQALYAALGMHAFGTRPRYYSDGEDALIMEGTVEQLIHGPHAQDGGQAAKASATQVRLTQMGLRVDEGEAVPAAAPSAQALPEESHPLIFAIESSCDETAAALVRADGTLVADVIASQIDFHARFGGVVPEIASRKHIEAICGVCDECFDVAARNLGIARLTWSDVDAIAVTYAPGLVGALVVGVAFAKGAAWGADKPFIGVNHLEGHLYANKLADADFAPPAVASLVSGGNTMLVHVRDWGDYETLGTTIDDAVGEAFDKVAKALDLGYPGGPIISKQAALGNPRAIAFPRAMLHSGDLRFSLSGLKTAVVTYINQCRLRGEALNIPDIAASFQQAVIDVQIAKARTALLQTGAKTFCLGGGVAANPQLRAAYGQLADELGVKLVMAPLRSCGDNAGMIALVALDRYRAGRFFDLGTDAYAHANLDEPY